METTQTARNMATGESHAVRECDRCGAEIAWVRSSRTGRNYPAMVVHTHTESLTRLYNLRVAPWQPHTREDCERRQAQRSERHAEDQRAYDQEEQNRQHLQVIDFLFDESGLEGDALREATQEELQRFAAESR